MLQLPHYFFLLTVQFLAALLIAPLQVSAANLPIEIINIKPAESGSPAIPSTHRIFYAYPGIEYKVRAAVIGGDYPYSYELSNAPAGMTVDTAGYIRWPNPQANADNIGLRITDSAGGYIDTTWSISVQTSGFGFVDVNAVSNGDGSLETPYDSIANMVATADSNDIIYFREGEYSLPARGDYTIGSAQAFQFDTPVNTASRWLSYPGETAAINLNNNRFFAGVSSNAFYFDGLTFKNGREYYFRTSSVQNYVTFLDNTFEALSIERENYNSNQGMFADGTPYGHGPKSENIEILYNYFRHDGGGNINFNRYSDQGTTWIYRNTFVCELQMTNLSDSDCDGPWTVYDNVFQNYTSGIAYN